MFRQRLSFALSLVKCVPRTMLPFSVNSKMISNRALDRFASPPKISINPMNFAYETRLIFDSYKRGEKSLITPAQSNNYTLSMCLVILHALKSTDEDQELFLMHGSKQYFEDIKSILANDPKNDVNEFCKFMYRLSKFDYLMQSQLSSTLGLSNIFDFAAMILKHWENISYLEFEILVHALELFCRRIPNSLDQERSEKILKSMEPNLIEGCNRYMDALCDKKTAGETSVDWLQPSVSQNVIRTFQRVICRLIVQWPEKDVQKLAKFLWYHFDHLFKCGQTGMCYYATVNLCETFLCLKVGEKEGETDFLWVDKFLTRWSSLSVQSPKTDKPGLFEALFYYYFGLISIKFGRFNTFSLHKTDWLIKMGKSMKFLTDEKYDTLKTEISRAVGKDSKTCNEMFKEEMDCLLLKR